MMTGNSVTVQVPASTSNLGSGFDTLGLAVRLYNRVRVSRAPGKGVRLVSAPANSDPAKALGLVRAAARLFFRRLEEPPCGIEVALSGHVPIGRGLGASATARLGVIAALNELTQAKLAAQQLLEWGTELEGHPDNVSPALFGGFTISGRVEGRVRCLRFRVRSRLQLVTLIPHFEINTEEARKLVPATFSKADTVHSLNRAALLAGALASGDYPQLRGLFDDRVHQPYRQALIPQLARVIRAGEKAGAIGGFLSGSGSAIMCLTLENAQGVARAMQRQLPRAMQRQLPRSEVRILTAENSGVRVLSSRIPRLTGAGRLS